MPSTRIAIKEVKFNATLVGSIDNLDVVIQGKLILNQAFVVAYDQKINSTKLQVIFQISGFNGTGFTIQYSCTSAGKIKIDPVYPADIIGTVATNGYIEISLSILI